MKHNGMANRANRGIRDDVSCEVVFGESMTASYVMICSSCLRGIATHGAHAVSPSERPQGQLPRYSRQLESVRRILSSVAAVVRHDPLHPHEVRAEQAWLISEKSLANCELWR